MLTIENFQINAVEATITEALASTNFYIKKADIEEGMTYHIIKAVKDIEYEIDGNKGTTAGLFIKAEDGGAEGVLTRSNFTWSKRPTNDTTKLKCTEVAYSKRDDKYTFTFEALD